MVSSMGICDAENRLNKIADGNILIWKRRAEKYLMARGFQSYTIIHPGGLLDAPVRTVWSSTATRHSSVSVSWKLVPCSILISLTGFSHRMFTLSGWAGCLCSVLTCTCMLHLALSQKTKLLIPLNKGSREELQCHRSIRTAVASSIQVVVSGQG